MQKNLFRFLFSLLFVVGLCSVGLSQTKKEAPKKYPSILWEITGKNLTKPSYLLGTMHVSNKMVFNLGDSFYHAIESVENVGLELDPGYWQEYDSKKENDMENSSISSMMGRMEGRGYESGSLYKSMFSIDAQEKKIEYTLRMEPTMINALLYRKSSSNQEHEEDTYLDLYLYQICNKLGKHIVGLEVIDSSERMFREANRALQEDKSRHSYDKDDYATVAKMEDAYKNGDLDLIDSIDHIQTPNKKYRAIFLDHRNEIQAKGIDSVLKLGKTIFAGVGCAHLPGPLGVIEVLRKMGYTMRPIKMNNRNSEEKERIDKIRFPVNFTTKYTSDSVIKSDIPGNWYRFERRANVLQYADMANGSYYMLGRVPTEGLFQGYGTIDMLKKVDSLLYENIPGKIISKTPIENSGYKGFDITNRTRRGDAQRYQIFVTPFEVIIAKMSGSTDYVLNGTEANNFFKSIQIKKIETPAALLYTPSWGAFSVSLPHLPYIENKLSGKTESPIMYEATDVEKGIHYCIMKETLNRNKYFEEDSFELKLMDESFMSSKVFEKQLSKKFVSQNGYPAFEASYQLKNGYYAMARFIIQGPHYFAVVAVQKKPFVQTPETLTSFSIQPFKYAPATLQKDTSFGYSFSSPIKKPNKSLAQQFEELGGGDYSSEMTDMLKRVTMLPLVHDSTGETINLFGFKFPAYTYIKDSSMLESELSEFGGSYEKADSSLITRKKIKDVKNGWAITEKWLSDTNSSRMLHNKIFYKKGLYFSVSQYTDTLTMPSAFSQSTFSSFMPADTLIGNDPFEPKGPLFFKEYASKDSTTHARALSNLANLYFKKEDIPQIEKSYTNLNWNTPNYLGIKKRFIEALGKIEDSTSTELLKKMYGLSNDTALYQQEILTSLLNQKTQLSFKTFEALFTNNPPVEVNTNLENNADKISDISSILSNSVRTDRVYSGRYKGYNNRSNESGIDGWRNLSDTLKLAKQILPGLLNFMNLDDYKESVQNLILEMADSGFVAAEEIKPFYTKFLLEGKHLYKKAAAQESMDAMNKKAEILNKDKKATDEEDDSNDKDDKGKEFSELYNHMVLLSPFYSSEQSVKDLAQQSFGLKSKEYRYTLMKLMIRKNISQFPDSLMAYYAKDDHYRRRLYNFLDEQKKLDLFPAANRKPMDLAKSQFLGISSNKPDTFAYVGMRNFTWKKDKGEMYFYKLKIQKTDKWKWGLVALLPNKKTGDWDLDRDFFDRFTQTKLDPDKTLNEQIDTLLKETINSKRRCAAYFYNSNDDRYYYDD